jgi:hypothetical protein
MQITRNEYIKLTRSAQHKSVLARWRIQVELILHPERSGLKRVVSTTPSSFIPHPSSVLPPAAPPGPGTDLLSPMHDGSEIEFVLVLNCW